MKKIFIAATDMAIGGAERALLGLLNALDKEKYQIDLFLLHQLNQSLTQQFLGSADTTIFFLFRSVFIFNIIHAVNSSFSEHIIDLCLFLAIYPSFA